MPRILEAAEIYRLTRKKTGPAQSRALRTMGIFHRVNPAGDVIVIDTDLPENAGRNQNEVKLNLDHAAT